MELQWNWENSIDNLTYPQLETKKKDILACLASAKTDEARNKYGEQLWYIISVMQSAKELTVVLKNAPDSRLVRVEDEPE